MQRAEIRGRKSEVALVCFALEDEARVFRKLAVGRNDVFILVTGIGRVNTEKSLHRFLEVQRPSRVLTCGFAGGLNPDLKTGDVVVEMPLTPAVSPSDRERENSQLRTAGAKPAKFFCSSHIATTAAEKAELRRTTGADAVEMESEIIHAICGEQGIPCVTVRVISDTAQEDLPLDFNLLANADQSLNYGKLAFAIAKSPGKIPALMRLQKNCKFAAGRLANVLLQVIEADLPPLER